ncbi:hypothetical protein ATM97_24880 [Nocardia sp. MH4]|uniref:hypothetical protein n=1 Tax=unclassified Nocardia TaxID=2637762 RepID=UPI001C4FC333|nr:hypothetical protein [Nocardia sp. MH4]MBW0273322.1 hypothetical protein [Nocardia sp. MH4]
MISRKTLAATGAAAAAAVMFLGPVAVAGADSGSATGSFSGSADLASGSADLSSGSAALTTGSAAGAGVLDSGSSALDGGTSALVNVIDLITGINGLLPAPAAS